ncbi:hypothetical protein [Microbacterium trichothecenolyticum]|uniref:Terminase small subunit n=1 Tax=Microbacterium trichothecenolyticum TaxID=69370 RepID=A0A0M2H5W0_MICTR|nr:hypothetical protein [Microbacterium trichothecenolyticum]KJL39920.1 hypothetical protein RS82_04133 [Microbacterium trichothecenolyticum]
MPGPPPSEKRSRARDNVQRDVIRNDGKVGGFDLRDLPEDFLPLKPKSQWEDPEQSEREEWHPATLRWWDNWRTSPQATRMVTDVDWDYMLDTALMHHRTWMSGGTNTERLAEIRIRLASFGATYADRLRLRLEVELPPEQHPAGAKGHANNVTDLDARRAALGA